MSHAMPLDADSAEPLAHVRMIRFYAGLTALGLLLFGCFQSAIAFERYGWESLSRPKTSTVVFLSALVGACAVPLLVWVFAVPRTKIAFRESAFLRRGIAFWVCFGGLMIAFAGQVAVETVAFVNFEKFAHLLQALLLSEG